MKRFFSLIAALVVFCAFTTAQELDRTFIFIDEQGNEVADGSVLTVSTFTHNDETGTVELKVPLRVKNIAGVKSAVSMYEVIDAKPNGQWQTCAFGNCMALYGTGYSPKNVVNENYEADIMTEWITEPGNYASWSATLQIHTFNIETKVTPWGAVQETAGGDIIGYGPKVTVNFRYADPSAIEQPTTVSNDRSYFSIGGQRTSALAKGLNIVKMADGKVIKRIVK